MKTKTSILTYSMIFISSFLLLSCQDAGETSLRLSGDEIKLPDELKGLKVYNVCIDNGNYVKVAILNNKINSTTYQVGKINESLLIIDKNSKRTINISNIISENDSIIVARK